MNNWLRTTGLDGNQHVLYKPEQDRHVLRFSCPCHPRIVATSGAGVIIHATLTPNACGMDEKEH